jgi:hypothetical protein
MVNTIHLAVPTEFHTTQLDLNTISRVSNKSGFFYTIILFLGKMKKPFFRFPALHCRWEQPRGPRRSRENSKTAINEKSP